MNTNEKRINEGYLDIWIDELVSCLRDTETNELKETVVFRIESRKYLKSFSKSNGWKINWYEIPNDVEVYALALKDTNEIQGLVALRNDIKAKAVYLHWACTAPWNNKYDFGKQKYVGVGGHLFAIAADKSVQWGYDGVLHGFAANAKLLEHYINVFNAEYLGMLHQFQFFINEKSAHDLLEVYKYEWY
jgi:hypothetical protein